MHLVQPTDMKSIIILILLLQQVFHAYLNKFEIAITPVFLIIFCNNWLVVESSRILSVQKCCLRQNVLNCSRKDEVFLKEPIIIFS